MGPNDPTIAEALGQPGDTTAIPVQGPLTPEELAMYSAAMSHVPGGGTAPDAPPARIGGPPPMSLSDALAVPVNDARSLANPFVESSNMLGQIPGQLNYQLNPRAYLGAPTGVTKNTWGEDRSAPPLVFPGGTQAGSPGGTQAGSDAIAKYSPLPANGTQRVGAQSVDLVSPEDQAAQRAEYSNQAQRYMGLQGSEVALGETKGSALLGEAGAVRKQRDQALDLVDKTRLSGQEWRELFKKAYGDKSAAVQQALQDKLEDPKTKDSVATKIVDVLGAGISGFAQGWNHDTSPNVVLQGIDQRHAQDLAMQRQNIEKHREAIGDYTGQMRDALEAMQANRSDQAQANELALKAGAFGSQAAALRGQAAIEPVLGAVQAGKTGLLGGETDIAGQRADMASRKYVPAHTVQTGPDQAKITAVANELYKGSKNPNYTPADALRDAGIIVARHDVTPGAAFTSGAELPKAAAGPAAAAEVQRQAVDQAFASLDPYASRAFANVGVGTAVGGLLPGGTAASDAVHQYNAQGAAILKSVESRLPQEEAERVFQQNYAAVPGLSKEQKEARQKAFKNHVRAALGVKGKAEGAEGAEGGGVPTGFIPD